MDNTDRLAELLKISQEVKNKEEFFKLTENHIAMLRKMTVVWDASESGAPVVQIYKPEGFYRKLAKMINIELDQKGFNPANTNYQRFEDEAGASFQIFLRYGRLKPGSYSYENPFLQMDILSWPADSYSNRTISLPRDKEIKFVFTERHAKLLKAANAGWLSYIAMPGINSKRPYGDMTFYEADMALLLGIVSSTEDCDDLSDSQLESLQALHLEMLFALQVYLQYAKIEPGTYYRKGYGIWVPFSGIKPLNPDSKVPQ